MLYDNSFNRIPHHTTILSTEVPITWQFLYRNTKSITTFPLGGLSSSFNQTLLSHIYSTILPCTLTFKEFINWMKIRKTKSQARWHLSDAVWHIIVPTSTTHVASLASSSLNIFFRFNSSHLISSNLILNSSINPSVTYLSNMLLSANQTQQNSSSFNLY